MKTFAATLVLNLAAWSDTAMGIELRIWMVLPVQKFDIGLAAYIVEYMHF